jgi:hypothetical protein
MTGRRAGLGTVTREWGRVVVLSVTVLSDKGGPWERKRGTNKGRVGCGHSECIIRRT